MSKHTPGPWRYEATYYKDDHDGWNIVAASGTVVGTEGLYSDHEADARLIAAAPELLEALRLVDRDERVDYNGSGTYTITVDGRDLLAIRAAIDKATGEQQ